MTSIIFMGTPRFAVPILEGLLAHNYEIKAVVTQPDRKVGRKQIVTKSPVKITAEKHQLRVYQPVKLPSSKELSQLISLRADLIVTAAYGQFLPTRLLRSVKIAAVNVHGSLLPKYRGGAPIQHALLNGERQTGITIMQMVKKMDAGDIYAQKAIKIAPEDTAGSLFDKLSLVGRDLLLATLPQIIAGTAHKIPQDPTQVVFAPIIKKSQERIKPTMTATQANNLVRALNPDPGAYLLLAGKRLKVWQAQVSSNKTALPAGCLADNHREFALSFAGGSLLNLKIVQPAGKKRMTVKNFLNGQGSKFKKGEQIVG